MPLVMERKAMGYSREAAAGSRASRVKTPLLTAGESNSPRICKISRMVLPKNSSPAESVTRTMGSSRTVPLSVRARSTAMGVATKKSSG